MSWTFSGRRLLRPAAGLGLLLLCGACATTQPEPVDGLKPEMVARAVSEAEALRAAGQRVWCVPFARNLSGVDIRGNAGTWWSQAEDEYARGHRPAVGAVMAFSATRSLPMGHVAVVSRVVNERAIQVDHANWKRSEVSLGMQVVDVSAGNDWSEVRVESRPGSFGKVYRVDGFIAPDDEIVAATVSTKGE